MDKLISKMQRNGVLLDTNLLVLLIVGLVDEKLIKTHKKLGAYTVQDFKILVGILETCKHIITTPHILAETSNLAVFGAHGNVENRIFLALRSFLLAEKFIEKHHQASVIVDREGYLQYGLSDIGLLEALSKDQKYVLLTDDHRFSGYAEKKNFDVLNFNHLRYAF